jgi:hypothetical protein
MKQIKGTLSSSLYPEYKTNYVRASTIIVAITGFEPVFPPLRAASLTARRYCKSYKPSWNLQGISTFATEETNLLTWQFLFF